MKIKRIGKIFDPTGYKFWNRIGQFAQSPQVLQFDNFVRIYFSTRSVDSNRKYLSHVAFVDMDNQLEQVLRVSTDTVLELGELGCFDEHGIFPLNVLRIDGAIYGFTCGWSRRVSVSVETGIGLVKSEDDGETFKRIGPGPILSASPHERCLVGDAFVIYENDTFHMLYIFGTGWRRFKASNQPERIYKIGYANSKDLINWKRNEGVQIVSDVIGPDECQALPTVINWQGSYHMFFCYRNSVDFRFNSANGYRIGYAYSDDLLSWKRDEAFLFPRALESDWDSDMQCYPHVFERNGKVYLLYNGNEFGRYGFGLAEIEF